MLGITVIGGVDGDAALHIFQRETARAVASHHTAGMLLGGGDGSCGNEVLDGGAVGIGKGGAELGITIKVDGQCVSIAVESATEGVVCIISHLGGDLDVIRHLKILAIVRVAIFHTVGKE